MCVERDMYKHIYRYRYMTTSAIFLTFLVSWGAEQLQPTSVVPSTQRIRRKNDFSETIGFGMVFST